MQARARRIVYSAWYRCWGSSRAVTLVITTVVASLLLAGVALFHPTPHGLTASHRVFKLAIDRDAFFVSRMGELKRQENHAAHHGTTLGAIHRELQASKQRFLNGPLPRLSIFILSSETEQPTLPSLWSDWVRTSTDRLRERLTAFGIVPNGMSGDFNASSVAYDARGLINLTYLRDPPADDVSASAFTCENLSVSCVIDRLQQLGQTSDFIWIVMPDSVPVGGGERLWTLLWEQRKSLFSIDRLALANHTDEQTIWQPLNKQQPTSIKFGTGLILRQQEIKLLLSGSHNSTDVAASELMQTLAAGVWGRLTAVEDADVGYGAMGPMSRPVGHMLTWVVECPSTEDVPCPLSRQGVTETIERAHLDKMVSDPLYFAARPLNDNSVVIGCPKSMPNGSEKYLPNTWANPTMDPAETRNSYGPEPAEWAKMSEEERKDWSPFKLYEMDAKVPEPTSTKCSLSEFLTWRMGL